MRFLFVFVFCLYALLGEGSLATVAGNYTGSECYQSFHPTLSSFYASSLKNIYPSKCIFRRNGMVGHISFAFLQKIIFIVSDAQRRFHSRI